MRRVKSIKEATDISLQALGNVVNDSKFWKLLICRVRSQATLQHITTTKVAPPSSALQ